MVDIYNEVGYIKDILSEGLSVKWRRDVTLLTRFYRMEGLKRKEALSLIKEKCSRLPAFEKTMADKNMTHKECEKIFAKAWNDKQPLRVINEIQVPRAILNWFLNLTSSYPLTDEEKATLHEKRPWKKFPKGQALSWEEVKFLWTLYIWYRIQREYSSENNARFINVLSYRARIKSDGDLSTSFNIRKEQRYLQDLGLIKITYKTLTTVCTFLDNPIFQSTEDPVSLKIGDSIGEGDLYNPGYFLQKQLMGSFVCQHCGKEFAHYTNNDRGRKYCKECSNLLRVSKSGAHKDEAHRTPRYCIDCGKEIIIFNPNDFKTCRCFTCQTIRNNMKKLEYKHRQQS